MENLLKKKAKIDVMKWLGWLIAIALVGGIAAYSLRIKSQLWFTYRNPGAVSACLEGYEGEHGEADRRFRLKQRSELLSPLPSTESGKGESR